MSWQILKESRVLNLIFGFDPGLHEVFGFLNIIDSVNLHLASVLNLLKEQSCCSFFPSLIQLINQLWRRLFDKILMQLSLSFNFRLNDLGWRLSFQYLIIILLPLVVTINDILPCAPPIWQLQQLFKSFLELYFLKLLEIHPPSWAPGDTSFFRFLRLLRWILRLIAFIT